MASIPLRTLCGCLMLVVLSDASSALAEEAMRTWMDATGQHALEAQLLDAQAGNVRLRKKNGELVTIALNKLSEPDRAYVTRVTKESTAPPAGKAAAGEEPAARNVAEVNLGDDRGSEQEGQSPVRESVVTGVGTDPEKARQNAFSNAIEHAVGVLVSAETVVENDELIREQVLNFSRGYVERFDVLKEWNEDGLHYVRLRATVAVNKLVEKLQASHIAVRDLPGELMARQVEHEVLSEENAKQMVSKAMEDYRMENLFDVEIVQKPEVVDRSDSHAKVRVVVKLCANVKKWRTMQARLRPLLERIATKRASYTTVRRTPLAPVPENPQSQYHGFDVDRVSGPSLSERLAGDGVLLSLLKEMNSQATVLHMDAFLVPKSVEEVVLDCKQRQNRVKIVLLDREDHAISETYQTVGLAAAQKAFAAPGFRSRAATIVGGITYRVPKSSPFTSSGRLAMHCLGPLLWSDVGFNVGYTREFLLSTVFDLPLDQLKAVSKCAAFIEGGS